MWGKQCARDLTVVLTLAMVVAAMEVVAAGVVAIVVTTVVVMSVVVVTGPDTTGVTSARTVKNKRNIVMSRRGER